MSGCAFYCFNFLNYNFPNFDLNLSLKTKERSERFKREWCDFYSRFSYCPCLPTPALAQGQGRRVLGTLEVLTPLSCLDQGYVWFSITPRLQFPVKKALNSKRSAHLSSFQKVKTRQRLNSHVWHQQTSCPICSFNIIIAQPMTLKALTTCLRQGQTLM